MSELLEFDLSICWDQDDVVMQDEELSATSHEEAKNVFQTWKTEELDLSNIMEVDEQIGSNLLGDEIFSPSSCESPLGPIEELNLIGLGDDDSSFILPSDVSDAASFSSSHPEFDEQYKTILRKLSESMKKSQETRKSLIMKTPETERYSRSSSVSGVISSIEKSSQQLQAYLRSTAAA